MSIICVTLSFLFFFTFYFQNVSAVPTRHVCPPEQRDALLEFKNKFWMKCNSSGLFTPRYPFPSPNMESWKNNSDCCDWEGVWCDPKTRDVVELHLHRSCLHGRFHSNTSLFRLQNLRSLDLSSNNLYGQIPSSIENFSHLTYLDLFRNQFSGQILSSIAKISHLTHLYISYNQFSGQIPSSIGNLSHLTNFKITGNQFTGRIPSSVGKLSNLKSLVLSTNNFSGQIPSSIGNLSHLEELQIAVNNFDGEIPSFLGNLNRLTFFSVARNKLSGSFPTALLNLTNLNSLSVAFNQFTGMIPPNISSLSKSNLKEFLANDNTFFGTPPSSLFNIPSKLQRLRLGGNKFKGPIPRSISKLVNLFQLDLSNWNTQGIKVDFSIFSHLKSLKSLYLSNLNTTTTIDLNAISSFFKLLRSLDLSGNHVLATNISSVQLSSLYLSSCGITEFPELLRTQLLMEMLDISNNKMKGEVPSWLWTLPNLEYLDLSKNTFNGFERSTKLGLSSALEHLIGSKNSFTGNIPSFVCELGYLKTLDLSDNNLNGSIPLCLENLKTNLSVLNLGKNHLSGGLPEYVFGNLRSLDVGHNQLVGKLPRSLKNFSTLEILNVESNTINDTFPFWLDSLQKLKVLVLRSNAFHGPIYQASFFTLKIIDISHNHFNGTLPSDYFLNWSNMSETNKLSWRQDYMGDGSGYYQDSMVLINKGIEMKMERILKIYTALDFSGNRLEGEIPRSISLLKEVNILNLSSNAFTGHIPSSMGNLTALESLDVSQNKLSGEIPQELGNLSFLAYMNFSHNQLVGLVPGGTQFRRQRCSSFMNNSGLFGPAFEDDCRDIRTPSSQQYETPETEEKEEEVETMFSWIAAAIGFGPGIVFGLTIGYILVLYKPEWFISPFGRHKRRRRSTTH